VQQGGLKEILDEELVSTEVVYEIPVTRGLEMR
jgi:hypothetical protein